MLLAGELVWSFPSQAFFKIALTAAEEDVGISVIGKHQPEPPSGLAFRTAGLEEQRQLLRRGLLGICQLHHAKRR